MKPYISCPAWAIKMIANLCVSQVKEQLPENIIQYNLNPPSFICNGQLFVFIHNRMLIDESIILAEPSKLLSFNQTNN